MIKFDSKRRKFIGPRKIWNLEEVPPKMIYEWVKTGKMDYSTFRQYLIEIMDDCIQERMKKLF